MITTKTHENGDVTYLLDNEDTALLQKATALHVQLQSLCAEAALKSGRGKRAVALDANGETVSEYATLADLVGSP